MLRRAARLCRAAGLGALLLLPVGALLGCASTSGAAGEGAGAGSGAAQAPGAAAGSPREQALASARARAAREEASERGERGSFDFGTGPLPRSRRRVAEAQAPEEPAADASGEAAGSVDGARPRTAAARRPSDDPPDLGDPNPFKRSPLDPAPARGVRVIWEALAVEREQVENPRHGRRPMRGVAPDLKTVLVSQSHPDARGREKGRAAAREQDGSQVAVLPDDDLLVLVRGLRQAGFFEVARPTGALASQFDDSEARGRVTVEVDGESRTVLSMRGQGATPATKDIPRVYSEAKQAIAVVRNNTPTLNVSTAGGLTAKPAVRPRRRGESRVLTEEEAAKALGGELPAGKADDDWGLGPTPPR